MNTIFSILIVVTTFSDVSDHQKTGVWFEEYAVPYQIFQEQGYNVTVATINILRDVRISLGIQARLPPFPA